MYQLIGIIVAILVSTPTVWAQEPAEDLEVPVSPVNDLLGGDQLLELNKGNWGQKLPTLQNLRTDDYGNLYYDPLVEEDDPLPTTAETVGHMSLMLQQVTAVLRQTSQELRQLHQNKEQLQSEVAASRARVMEYHVFLCWFLPFMGVILLFMIRAVRRRLEFRLQNSRFLGLYALYCHLLEKILWRWALLAVVGLGLGMVHTALWSYSPGNIRVSLVLEILFIVWTLLFLWHDLRLPSFEQFKATRSISLDGMQRVDRPVTSETNPRSYRGNNDTLNN